MARILSVSYDQLLLQTRQMLLKASGYDVTSALGFKESIHHCEKGEFDLFILGHSIPLADKEALIEAFRKSCPGVIVSLRKTNESDVLGADYYIEPDPRRLLALVAKVLGDKSNRATPTKRN